MRTGTSASLSLLASVLGVASVLALSGCELIAAVDHDLLNSGGGGAGTGGGTGGTPPAGGGGQGGGTGGSGGGTECTTPDECPDAPACQAATCDNNTCGTSNLDIDTVCDLEATGDGFCDGEGNCGECNDDTQCTGTDTCDTTNHVCVAPHCNNTTTDADETDLNCGGLDCAPCANDLMCDGVDANCLSGFCGPGDICAACAAGDCPANQYCDTAQDGGTCVDDKADGQACADNDECTNSHCETIGGGGKMCCDTACAGSCQSCAAADTGGTNGTCADITNGTDPKNLCPTVECKTGVCQAGSCGNSSNTTNCGTGPACAGDDLKPQDKCDGAGTCMSPTNADCGVYSCDTAANPDACFTTCNAQADCAANGMANGNYCIGVMGTVNTTGGPGANNTCTAKKAATGACLDNIECQSGNCDTVTTHLCL